MFLGMCLLSSSVSLKDCLIIYYIKTCQYPGPLPHKRNKAFYLCHGYSTISRVLAGHWCVILVLWSHSLSHPLFFTTSTNCKAFSSHCSILTILSSFPITFSFTSSYSPVTLAASPFRACAIVQQLVAFLKPRSQAVSASSFWKM